MNKVELTALINSIKSDDLVLFSKFIKNNESIRYGRFPVLSLLYLYSSNKIIKAYKDTLLKVKYYTEIEEPIEFYQKFKAVAGRSLRLYLGDNFVHPIEMLAILNKDNEVKKVFKKLIEYKTINDKITKNLTKIYTINKQSISTDKNKIKISAKRFNKKDKMFYRIGLISSFAFIILCCSLLSYLNFSVGLGTSSNPYKIYNATQLIQALNTSGHYTITKDITLTDELPETTFDGNLEGNGHTLTINYIPSKNVISTNNGTISNISVVYSKKTGSIYESLSLFSGTNNGTIKNVDITCEEINLTCNKSSNDMYVNAYANNNNGTIENCDLTFYSTLSSTGNGECYVSGFVGVNAGTINNCEFTKGSIDTKEADVSGFCIDNEENGVIKNSRNYASVSQLSALNNWSPNSSGFCMNNYGKIEHCTNYGEITATSINEEEKASGNVLLGGIASNNYGLIQKCLNKGTLSATAKKIIIYAGGISGYSSYWTNSQNTTIVSSILNCGTQGKINVLTEDEYGFVFAGSISGYMWGEIKNCYSLSEFNTANNDEKYFIGSLIGSAYLEYGFYSFIRIETLNNYVLQHENTTYQIGSLIYNGSIVSSGTNVDNEGLAKVITTNADTIKQKEVYFDE